MNIIIATGTHQAAMLLATQLRIPRGTWTYASSVDVVRMTAARASLVLIDEAAIDQHERSEEIQDTLYELQLSGSIVLASIMPTAPVHFRA